jgi:hypothetical protein
MRARLLDCEHHHVIFTIPHELNALWMLNTAMIMQALFGAVRSTLSQLLADARYLGAQPGAVLALHTFLPGRQARRLGGKISAMKVATGTVVNGKVVVEGETLTEGETVTVLLRETSETFELTPEEEDELLESIASIERGDFVSGQDLLERLRRFG